MGRAVAAAEAVRGRTAPNPPVGAALLLGSAGPESDGPDPEGGRWFVGATAPPGGPHAEIRALLAAAEGTAGTVDGAAGSTLFVTLEPCAHHGRTPPCTDAIIEAGVSRVVVAVEDPDPQVSGAGLARLRAAGITVDMATEPAAARDQLAAYLKHRTTGRPWVVLKLATTLDGRTAAPDDSSRWITGEAARLDAHRLRAQSDAVLVGAGTVRIDDPSLTVRLPADDPSFRDADAQPLRVVLGTVPEGAAVAPALELSGDLGAVLDELGRRGVLQVLVEGGAAVAHAFHLHRLVDRYVLYLAPALFGGDDARPVFAGPGAPTIDRLWRGSVASVTSLGGDLRVDLAADES